MVNTQQSLKCKFCKLVDGRLSAARLTRTRSLLSLDVNDVHSLQRRAHEYSCIWAGAAGDAAAVTSPQDIRRRPTAAAGVGLT